MLKLWTEFAVGVEHGASTKEHETKRQAFQYRALDNRAGLLGVLSHLPRSPACSAPVKPAIRIPVNSLVRAVLSAAPGPALSSLINPERPATSLTCHDALHGSQHDEESEVEEGTPLNDARAERGRTEKIRMANVAREIIRTADPSFLRGEEIKRLFDVCVNTRGHLVDRWSLFPLLPHVRDLRRLRCRQKRDKGSYPGVSRGGNDGPWRTLKG